MKPLYYLLPILFLFSFDYGFAQEKTISKKPTIADFIAGDSSRNYILGDEGIFSILLKTGHYANYYNEDSNDLYWNVLIVRNVRLRVTKSLSEVPLFFTDKATDVDKATDIDKATLFYLNNGVLKEKKLSNKNWTITTEGDRKMFFINLEDTDLPVILDYSYSEAFFIKTTATNSTNLTFAINNCSFPSAYAKVKFIIPEHFSSETKFLGVNKIIPKITHEGAGVTVNKRNVENAYNEKGHGVVYTYNQQVESYFIENINSNPIPNSITLVVKPFKKVVVQ